MKNNSKKTNRIKEPSKFAIKFANTVFVLGILFSVLVAAYAVYKINNPLNVYNQTFYYSFLLFAILTAILFVLGLSRLPDELKVNMSVLFVAVIIEFYGFETYLEFSHEEPQYPPPGKVIAEQMGVPFDTRTKIEVIEDLRDSGINAYPNIFPNMFISSNGLNAGNGRIYPLGGISNITTILENESGYYPIIETDGHGFNNPKGLYKNNKVDIVLTGDSFTEGYSVHSDETIAAGLKKSGFNTINLGRGGNGSLIEFAALKEYAEPLKPKIVLWVYYVNDLSNLEGEMELSLLRKYLNEEDFSQNLISRQDEIDSVLINYANQEYEKQTLRNDTKVFIHKNPDLAIKDIVNATGVDESIVIQIIEEIDREKKIEQQIEREKIINHWAKRVFKLTNLRTRINLTPTPTPTPTPEPKPEQLKIFKDILEKSKKMVSGWGGKMYFVYLPEFWRYSTGEEHINREFILHTVNEMMIPIIDIHKEVFDPHPDLLSLFPFRMYGHYNADGYRLVAEAISKKLKADGIIPLNSKN